MDIRYLVVVAPFIIAFFYTLYWLRKWGAFSSTNNMSKKITFSAFGRDSYYHRDWFKKNGFKFDRSSRKWTVENLPIDNAEEFASYCRKYGLTFERSDRMITEFDYADYLWDGRRDEFMKPSENIEIPQPKNKI